MVFLRCLPLSIFPRERVDEQVILVSYKRVELLNGGLKVWWQQLIRKDG